MSKDRTARSTDEVSRQVRLAYLRAYCQRAEIKIADDALVRAVDADIRREPMAREFLAVRFPYTGTDEPQRPFDWIGRGGAS